MLQHLSIKNYALIDLLELDLHSGFSVITGETGAGKSIILGALNLVLGKRADLKVLKDTSKKCVVEAIFLLNRTEHERFFAENDIDFEEQTILRREILASGKSRAFINDTPVNLSQINQLAEKAIDVHSQHQNLLLSDSAYQLRLLDSFAKNNRELLEYQKAYGQFLDAKKQLSTLEELAQKEVGDTDYINFLLQELEESKLEPGEQESLESELAVLEHAEEIESNLSAFVQNIEAENGQGVRQSLVEMDTSLRSLSKFHKDYEELQSRFESLKIEFEDISREVELKLEDTEFEPGHLEKLDQRLSLLVNLQKKHNLASVEELLIKKEELGKKVEDLTGVESRIQEVKHQLELAEQNAFKKAEKLHKSRAKAAPAIALQIMDMLGGLNMKTADFEISVSSINKLNSNGFDEISFTFSANKGLPKQALAKVASGGEMSRVMLALKAIMARENNLPSIIFDEIDTGVSGETAGKIGLILKEMGDRMQVIAITHLPQIASMGGEHYKVLKASDASGTLTTISHLSKNDRLNELARLLSGEEISEAALANARTMLGMES